MTLLVLLSPSGAEAQDEDAGGSPLEASDTAPEAWSEAAHVTVVQRLAYERAGRFTLTVFGGLIPNDPFVSYAPVGLRFGRFLNESLLMELSASYMDVLAFDKDLRDRVGRIAGERSVVRLQDHQVARAQWSAAWTVLAGKARRGDGSLVYLRGHLLGGFGALLARDASDALDPRAEGLVGLGGEAHLSDTGSVRLELRQSVFQRESGGVLLPTELSLGYVHHFGGPLGGLR